MLLLADSDPIGLQAALIASLIANAGGAVSTYLAYRKGKVAVDREASAAELDVRETAAKLTREERDDAVKQWRDFAKNAVAANAAEIADLKRQMIDLKKEAAEVREREMKCEIQRAVQEREISHLKDEIAELRQIVSAKPPPSGGVA